MSTPLMTLARVSRAGGGTQAGIAVGTEKASASVFARRIPLLLAVSSRPTR